MELLLIRHALPERIEDAGEPADPVLAPEGHEQALRLAAWLAPEGIDAVYSSPLRRALQTAAPLAEVTGHDVVIDDEIAEFDRDAHFYIPYEELKATKDERWVQMLSGDWAEVDPGTFQAVVVGAIERVVGANASKRVAVVCHGGVINAYAAHILALEYPLFFEPHYTSVSRVQAARTGERSILSLNEIGHLQGTVDTPAS